MNIIRLINYWIGALGIGMICAFIAQIHIVLAIGVALLVFSLLTQVCHL